MFLSRAVIGVSTLTAVVWGVTNDSRTSQMVALAPLIIVASEAARWWWTRPDLTRRTKYSAAGAAIVVGVTALAVLLSRRPGGWSTDVAVEVIGQTDENLVEAIGVLGWLDTLVPWFAVYLWLILIGVLIAVAMLSGLRTLGWAAVLAATTVVTSWIFELYQGSNSATYWQGRYSLPLLIGIPMLLTLETDRVATPLRDFLGRADRLVAGGALLILNVAAWAAARRWGVGTRGSHLPWRWRLDIQPLPPLLLLIAHAALTAALLAVVLAAHAPSADVADR